MSNATWGGVTFSNVEDDFLLGTVGESGELVHFPEFDGMLWIPSGRLVQTITFSGHSIQISEAAAQVNRILLTAASAGIAPDDLVFRGETFNFTRCVSVLTSRPIKPALPSTDWVFFYQAEFQQLAANT